MTAVVTQNTTAFYAKKMAEGEAADRGAHTQSVSSENGCPCLLCYGVGEDEEIVHTAEGDEYAFMDSVMRVRPGCHRRVVRIHVLDGDTATRSNCQRF